jgi:hypothetical protein
MSGTTLLKSTAFLALATVTVALPAVAHAQERAHEDRRDNGDGERRGGGWNRGQAQQQAAPQAQFQRQQQVQPQVQAQAQAQVQAQQQAQAQRSWHGRNEAGIARPQAVPQPGTGWQGRYQGQAQVPQAVPAQRNWQGGQQYQGRNQGYVDTQRNRAYGGDRREGYRDGNRGQYQGQYQGQYGSQYQGNQYRGNQYDRGQRQAWNNGWRRDQRYNWQGYRNQNRDIFRGGRYYAPYNGYSYRQLGIGFFLDQAFFGENYWIGDPGYYRLPPAEGPYRWVRYYDDVLLVNIYTGEVIDEIHDFFW